MYNISPNGEVEDKAKYLSKVYEGIYVKMNVIS